MTRLKTILFATLLPLAHGQAVAYDPLLEYQNRGDHWEGIQPRQVSGNLDIELLSALVDYTEPKPGFPVAKLLFYLKESAQIDLTVRELVPKRYYVLNRVREKETWQDGFNPYQWSTAEVLQPLKLTMTELGVIARVNRTPNRHEESVAPVIFYHSQPPTQITGYRFVFKVGETANLNYAIYQGENNPKPLVEKPLGKKDGGQPFTIIWECASAKAGEYELVVDGYSLRDNANLHQSVKFDHQPEIQGKF